MHPETPDADAAEQAREEQPMVDEDTPGTVPDDVDAADLADQAKIIPAEDDYDY